MSRNDSVKLPEVVVFAGPNGSGKSTITRMAKVVGEYINADDIKATTLCTDMEAALKAEQLREDMIAKKKDFTFETVLSSDYKLNILRKAKEEGYFIKCVFVLTEHYTINLLKISKSS
jgi:predicted ABC-type ATPase